MLEISRSPFRQSRSMLTRILCTLTLAGASLMLDGSSAQAQALIPCAPDSVPIAIGTLDGLRDVATGTTSGDSVWRASLDLPRVDSSQITIVNDPIVCDAAARAWARLIGPTASADAVWVYAYGSDRYFIFDERRPTIGTLLIGVFDRSFVWLRDVLR